MKIVIGINNLDKLNELRIAFKLDDLSVNLLSLEEFPDIGEIPEDGKTLKENALIKARTVNSLTRLPTLSDDTGLEVDALHGKPGVYTARYAGENCTYSDNVFKLLNDLDKVPIPNRTATFRTVVAYVDGDFELTAEVISRSSMGDNGFGYDPIFYIEEERRTFAQMSADQKEVYSHRGKAIRAMKQLLLPHIKKSIKKELA